MLHYMMRYMSPLWTHMTGHYVKHNLTEAYPCTDETQVHVPLIWFHFLLRKKVVTAQNKAQAHGNIKAAQMIRKATLKCKS